MSISNRHSIVPFVSGKSAPMHGQRMAKVAYKSSKANPAKFPNVFASIPFLPSEVFATYFDRLLPHVKALCEEGQDKIIKSLYESSEGSLKEVSDNEIGMEAILSFLDAESSGGRLTKEMIQNWFTGELKDTLAVFIAEKLGFNDPSEAQLIQIGQHVKGYEEVFASLAGGATVLHEKQIKGCKVALALANSENDVAVKLMKRLENMEKPVMVKELLEL